MSNKNMKTNIRAGIHPDILKEHEKLNLRKLRDKLEEKDERTTAIHTPEQVLPLA